MVNTMSFWKVWGPTGWVWEKRQVNASSAPDKILQLWGHQILWLSFTRRSLLYNLDFSNSHSMSCNCLPRHWLLSKQTKSSVMRPQDIQMMQTEEKGCQQQSQGTWERSENRATNKECWMPSHSQFLQRGWLCAMMLKSLGGSLNSPAICS